MHFIAGLNSAGAETALTRLVENLDKERIDNVVVSLSDEGDLGDRIKHAGARLYVLPLKSALDLLRFPFSLRRLLARETPNILQGWMLHGNLVARLAALWVGANTRLAWNLRMTAANLTTEKGLTMALTRAAAGVSGRVDLLVSNSFAGLTDHQNLGYRATRTVVIPNGFDLAVFRPDAADRRRVRAGWGVAEADVIFGLAGRTHPGKRHVDFIQAAAGVSKSHPSARFLLVGRGTDSSEVRQQLANAGVEDRFIVLGARTDVAAVMRGLDVLCLVSQYEGFPNVVGEAMATSIPVIATRVSDVPMIVGDTGFIVSVGDVKAVVKAMDGLVRMSRASRLALGARARCRVMEAFDLGDVVAKYESAYLGLFRPTDNRNRQSNQRRSITGDGSL